MNIEKVIQDDRQAKITVEYAEQEFEGFKRRAAKKIAKNSKIPGFRPGKAPYNIIVNHYGEGAILQEALDILLDDDYAKILKDAEVEPSGVGNLETIESYDPPRLVFLIPLAPEIELGDYREIRKEYELDEFDISQVDDFIDNLRRNAATIVPADRPAEEGDLIYLTLSGEFLNPEEGEDAVITDKTAQQVLVHAEGEESDREWPYRGFGRDLIGAKSGDSKEIQHTFSEDHEDEEYRGKTAVFTAEIQTVKALELPEFDEDFVQTLGNFDTPEDFRTSVDERLRTEHKDAYDREYFNELINEITENTEINYPPQMLEHEEEHVLEDIKSRLDRQNLDYETYLKLRDTDEEKFIEEEVRPAAKERLERSLIVDALIESEELKLDQEMLKDNINDVMTEVFYSGDAKEMQKQMGKEEFSRALSMEGVSRTMNTQIQNRLKLIATGQPIPEEQDPEVEPEPDESEDESDATVESGDETDMVEPPAGEPAQDVEEPETSENDAVDAENEEEPVNVIEVTKEEE